MAKQLMPPPMQHSRTVSYDLLIDTAAVILRSMRLAIEPCLIDRLSNRKKKKQRQLLQQQQQPAAQYGIRLPRPAATIPCHQAASNSRRPSLNQPARDKVPTGARWAACRPEAETDEN
jgi:prephenate dehydratase